MESLRKCPYLPVFVGGSEKAMASHSSTLPGKSRGQKSLVGCCPWGHSESDMTERLHFHFSLPCIGEGNGNPLQYFCLENPRDGGDWQAAIYGVTQSWTRLSSFDFTFHFHHWRRKWQTPPVFLPGESQGWGRLMGCRLWGHPEVDTTEVTQQQQQQQ